MIGRIINKFVNIVELLDYHFSAPSFDRFNYDIFKRGVLDYVESLHAGGAEYSFSKSCVAKTLYASCYACMIKGLFGQMSLEEMKSFKKYFDTFQQPDGLFTDNVTNMSDFVAGDGWGSRHLALHMCIAYKRIEATPKYRFSWLDD